MKRALLVGSAYTMVLAILSVGLAPANAQQDSKKSTLTPLPGAEQSIDDLIGGVRALRNSGDLSRHQERHFLRLAERADQKFDKGDFSESLKILGTFQTNLTEELGEGAISQATFDSLNSLNATATALVSGQQVLPPLKINGNCTAGTINGARVLNYSAIVSWNNVVPPISGQMTASIQYFDGNGNSVGVATNPAAGFGENGTAPTITGMTTIPGVFANIPGTAVTAKLTLAITKATDGGLNLVLPAPIVLDCQLGS